MCIRDRGTFGVLYGLGEVAEDGQEFWGNIAQDYTAVAAYAYLVFNLLCAPCFAAIGAIRREMNNAKWTWFAIGYQCLLAYCVSLVINQVGNLVVYGIFSPWLIVEMCIRDSSCNEYESFRIPSGFGSFLNYLKNP